MISLVIISNDIPLSPPIALTYHFVLDGLSFCYTKSHSFIIENQFSYIAFLRNALAAILFIKKRSFHYIITVLIFTH